MNTSLIGQPSAWSENVAAVGPTVEAGSIAVADSANGLGQASVYALMLDTSRWHRDDDRLGESGPTGIDPLGNPANRLATEVASPRLDAKASTVRGHDEPALAQTDWLIGLGARLRGWLGPRRRCRIGLGCGHIVSGWRDGSERSGGGSGPGPLRSKQTIRGHRPGRPGCCREFDDGWSNRISVEATTTEVVAADRPTSRW